MAANEKPLDEFDVTAEQLNQAGLWALYEAWTEKRQEFNKALVAVKAAKEELKNQLEPVLPANELAKGRRWDLKDNDDVDGLMVQIFASEEKRKGKQKRTRRSVALNITQTPAGKKSLLTLNSQQGRA
jgi:hypothetical protein